MKHYSIFGIRNRNMCRKKIDISNRPIVSIHMSQCTITRDEICTGNGKCLELCECRCISRNNYTLWKFCVCGHERHQESCVPRVCHNECEKKRCFNFRYCHVYTSQRVLDKYDDLCIYCWKYYGKIIETNKIEKCSLCFQLKQILHTKYTEMCFECFEEILDSEVEDVFEHNSVLRYSDDKEN